MNEKSTSILLVSVVLLFYLLGGSSSKEYKEVRRIAIDDHFDAVKRQKQTQVQPPSLLFDINGDGKEELIVVTSSMHLRVYFLSKEAEGTYMETSESDYLDVSLLANAQLRSIQSIICMKAYRTQYRGRELGVIAILTNNGILSCYDEQLRLLWKVSIYETNLINMSNLFITTSALFFSRHSLYVAISYSLHHASVTKALRERLTSEEMTVLKKSQITLGQDVDLAQLQSHPQLYILEKYKVTEDERSKMQAILDRVLSINDMQVLKLSIENGDMVWRNSVPQHIKHQQLIPQLQPILNEHDSVNRVVDSSGFSQSVLSFFPHTYRSFRDSSISLHSYHHNVYSPRAVYMDSPLRSLLPLDLVAALKKRIHSQHTLSREVKEEEENVVVIHSSHGLFVLDRRTGALITDVALPPHKVFVVMGSHLGGVANIFLAPQPFTGGNNELESYSPCFLQILAGTHVVASTNICGQRRGRSEDDEILVVPPIVLYDAKGAGESIVTLTSEGVLTCLSMEGGKKWSKKTGVTWTEFDEKAGVVPMLFAMQGSICVASAKAVVMYSPQGRVVSRIPLPEALVYPAFAKEEEVVLQTASSVLLYRASRMTYYRFLRIVVVCLGAGVVLYSIVAKQLAKQLAKQAKEKLM